MVQEIGFRKRYRVRRPIPGKESLEVTFPFEFAEREARRRGITVDEFIKHFVTEVEFNGAPSVTYTFIQDENNQSEQ
jgi:hypothetical protein